MTSAQAQNKKTEDKPFDPKSIKELGDKVRLGTILLRVKQAPEQPPYAEFSQLNNARWNNTFLSMHQLGKTFDVIPEMVDLIQTDTVFPSDDLTSKSRILKVFPIGTKTFKVSQWRSGLPKAGMSRQKTLNDGSKEWHNVEFTDEELLLLKEHESVFRPHIPVVEAKKELFKFTSEPAPVPKKNTPPNASAS